MDEDSDDQIKLNGIMKELIRLTIISFLLEKKSNKYIGVCIIT